MDGDGPEAGAAHDALTGAREAVAAARGELGRLLSGLRRRAGFSQRHLARLAGYSATVVASAETGRPYVSAKFWELADDTLGAGGRLTAGYERVRRLEVWAREQARDNEPVSQDGQPRPLPGIAVPGGGRTMTTPAIGICPHCRQPLAMVAQLAAAAPEPATNPPSPR